MGFAVFESIATVVSAVINELLVLNGRTLWTDLAIEMSYSLILAIGFGLILELFDPGEIRRWIYAGITAGCLLTLTNIVFNHVFGNLFLFCILLGIYGCFLVYHANYSVNSILERNIYLLQYFPASLYLQKIDFWGVFQETK